MDTTQSTETLVPLDEDNLAAVFELEVAHDTGDRVSSACEAR